MTFRVTVYLESQTLSTNDALLSRPTDCSCVKGITRPSLASSTRIVHFGSMDACSSHPLHKGTRFCTCVCLPALTQPVPSYEIMKCAVSAWQIHDHNRDGMLNPPFPPYPTPPQPTLHQRSPVSSQKRPSLRPSTLLPFKETLSHSICPHKPSGS